MSIEKIVNQNTSTLSSRSIKKIFLSIIFVLVTGLFFSTVYGGASEYRKINENKYEVWEKTQTINITEIKQKLNKLQSDLDNLKENEEDNYNMCLTACNEECIMRCSMNQDYDVMTTQEEIDNINNNLDKIKKAKEKGAN